MAYSTKTFSNHEKWLFGPTISIVIFYISIALLSLLIIGLSCTFVYSRLSGSSIPFQFGEELIFAILGLPLFISLPSISINENTKIQVLDQGLKVRVFHFYFTWKFIPWDEVLDLTSSPAFFPWNQPVWLIKVKKLTIWHVFISKAYFTSPNPGILLLPTMENREDLLEILTEKVPKLAS
jgi:hypothetical protein